MEILPFLFKTDSAEVQVKVGLGVALERFRLRLSAYSQVKAYSRDSQRLKFILPPSLPTSERSNISQPHTLPFSDLVERRTFPYFQQKPSRKLDHTPRSSLRSKYTLTEYPTDLREVEY